MHPINNQIKINSFFSITNNPTFLPEESSFIDVFPVFAEEDQAFEELLRLNICDTQFNPHPDYALRPFPFITNPTLLTPFNSFICTYREAFLNNFFTIYEIIQNLYTTEIPIQETELFGSYLIELMGEKTISTLLSALFPLPPSLLQKWMGLNYMKELFQIYANDIDIRFLTDASIDKKSALSSKLLHLFIEKLNPFDAISYCERLKEKYPFLQPDSFLVKQYSLLEFGGVTKRKIIEKKNFVIFGHQTNDRPIEWIFIGKENTPPHSSANCLSMPLLPFIQSGGNVLHFNSGPFSPAKVLIDLVTNSQSLHNLNVDSWMRYLRNYKRFTLYENEAQLIAFLCQEKEKEHDPAGLQELFVDPHSASAYLYYLLRKELGKVNKQNDERVVFQYLLRASISLYENCAELDEETLRELWQVMRKSFQKEGSQNFATCMAEAFLDEKIPFSILHAWLGMLGFLHCPHTLTRLGWIENGRLHAFCLQIPFKLRIIANPGVYSNQILAFLQKSPQSLAVLTKIEECLQDNFEKAAFPHPLAACFPAWNFKSNQMAEEGWKWVASANLAVKKRGLRTLLLCDTTYAEKTALCQHLFALLQGGEGEDFIIACAGYFEGSLFHQKILNQLQQFRELDPLITALIKTKDAPLIRFGWQLWEAEKGSDRGGWQLFQALTPFSKEWAFKHLQDLEKKNLLSIQQFVEGCLLLAPAINVSPLLPLLLSKATREDHAHLQLLIPYLNPFIQTIEGHALFKKACLQGLFSAQAAFSLWIDLLEANLKISAMGSAALFYSLQEENLICRMDKSDRIQTYKVHLATALFMEEPDSLTFQLIEELVQTPLHPSLLPPLFASFAAYLEKKIKKGPIQKETVSLLSHLLLITTTDQNQRFLQILESLSQQVIDPLILPDVDGIFIHAVDLLKNCQGAREIYLNYLQHQLSSRELLGQLFESIFKLEKPSPRHLTLLKIGSALPEMELNLSPFVQKWVSENQIQICTFLLEKKCPGYALPYLKMLHRGNQLASGLPIGDLCSYFYQTQNFEALDFLIPLANAQEIRRAGFLPLHHYIEGLLKKEKTCDAAKWIQASAPWIENEEEQTAYERNLFPCLSQFKKMDRAKERFDLLAASPFPKDKENGDLFISHWLEIACGPFNKMFFISPPTQHFKQELMPMAKKAVLELLEQGTKDAATLFEFFEYYNFRNEKMWGFFLTCVNQHGSIEILEKSACLFHKLNPSLQPEHWIEAIRVLKKGNLCLIPYLSFQKCKNASKEIFLHEISKLCPKKLDEEKFNRLIEEKDKLLKIWPELQLECCRALVLLFKNGEHLLFLRPRILETLDASQGSFQRISFIPAIIEKYLSLACRQQNDEEILEHVHSIKEYPIESLIKILGYLKKPSLSLLPIIQTVLKHGSVQDFNRLKAPLLHLLPRLYAMMPLTMIKEGEDILKESLKSISLTPAQQALLIHAWLCQSLSLDNSMKILRLYAKWAPRLIPFPEFANEQAVKAIESSLHYAKGDKKNQSLFNAYFNAIMGVSSKKSYRQMCVEVWKKHSCSIFLQNAFLDYCYKLMDSFSKRQCQTDELLDAIDIFIYCWPLPPKNPFTASNFFCEKDAEMINPDFSRQLEELLSKAHEANAFSNNSSKWIEYLLYFNHDLNVKTRESPPYRITNALIQKMVDFQAPSALLSAIRLLEQWEGGSNKSQWESFTSNIDKIIQAAKPFPSAIIEGETLLQCLYKKVLEPININDTYVSLSQKYLEKIANAIFATAWQHYKLKELDMDLKIHYLDLCLCASILQYKLQGKNKNHALFTKRLNNFIPEILMLETAEWKRDEILLLDRPKPGALVGTFNYLLLETKAESPACHEMQRDLLISWLGAMMEKRETKAARRCCEFLCSTLLLALENLVLTHHHQASKHCYKKALTWIPQYSTSEESHSLDYFNILFDLDNLLKDYPDYIQRVQNFCQIFLKYGKIHAHSQGVERISRLFFNVPKASLQPDEIILRNMAFACFLKEASFTANEQSGEIDDPLKMVLAKILKEGIKNHLFDHPSNEILETIAPIITWLESHPSLQALIIFLKIKFYPQKFDSETLRSYFPALKKKLIETKDNEISNEIIKFINILFSPPTSKELIDEWVEQTK